MMGKLDAREGRYTAGMTPPKPKRPDPKRIDHNDPSVQILGHYLRKNAEFEARQEMERLVDEAKRQADEPPQRNL